MPAPSVLMGAKQSLVEADAPASPRSPTSPRVLPVDGSETSMPAVQSIRSRLELITETAPIASRLPTWMLPTNDKDSIKKSITEAFDDVKKDKADDPNRINYTINAVEAIVDNRSQRTEQNLREMAATQQRLEAELAETRKELSEMKSEMMALLQRVVEKVDA